ncbi:polysaccharide biosynthesis C-terminal domain-containing protein [Vibrio vulnificus]|uniref:oligosaccharide flippase family protein n=1 Tax=Vibrio vulnificus TaxID=672 RepID=UPI001A1AF1DB|nr:polysaccharide biosynthesis C-terminal domain-containing protein [Vibrio vulnificus]HAS8400528.1 hypothetical protein [Vibrio vulnificus]
MIKIIFLLLTSSIISSLASFLTQMNIASNFNPESFGELNSAISLVVLLSPLLAMGVDGYLLKYYSDNDGAIRKFNIYSGKYFILSLIPCFVIYALLASDFGFSFFIIVVSQSMINLAVAHCQARGLYKLVSVLLSIQAIFRLVGVFILIILNQITPELVYWLYVCIGSFVMILSLFVIVFLNINNHCELTEDCGFSSFLKKSYPFGMAVFFHLIYFQSDILILNKLYSSEYAGYYSAAFTVVISAYLIPSVIYQKYLLPKIHHISLKEPTKEKNVFNDGFKLMLIIGVLVTAFFYIFSSDVINLVFGNKYDNSSEILSLLSICILFRYLSSNAGVFLVTGELIKIKNKYMAACALFNVVLNLMFVPYYGAVGAAYTTILTEILLCTLFYLGVNKYKFKVLNLNR